MLPIMVSISDTMLEKKYQISQFWKAPSVHSSKENQPIVWTLKFFLCMYSVEWVKVYKSCTLIGTVLKN